MPWILADGTTTKLPSNAHLCADGQVVNNAETLNHHPALVLNFASDSDGRAFSQCAQLRRIGYKGLIAADGELGLDRLILAFRCGFSLAWISDEEYEQLSAIHLAPFHHYYQ